MAMPKVFAAPLCAVSGRSIGRARLKQTTRLIELVEAILSPPHDALLRNGAGFQLSCCKEDHCCHVSCFLSSPPLLVLLFSLLLLPQ